MNSDDYQQIKKVFHSVIDLAPEERAGFLDNACGDDQNLRNEVEKLIESSESGFMEEPAIGAMAEAFAGTGLKVGQSIGHYQLGETIGKGGMGEVYLARDTMLNRNVAIKFLSDKFGNDADKLNRFVQEAQTASALNQPNIITIYEIGEFDNSHYIVTEFIEGKTLTKELEGRSQTIEFVLDTAIQIASALEAAHDAGIVHRDIKPDNIIVRPDGLVKILDFGIAKLTENPTSEDDGESARENQVNTTPGMIIGTANYMSPEQAKGQHIDSGTDIFSFGVVLYEMVSGELPFQGETPMEITASIIKNEPKLLNDSKVPADMVRVIRKTLRKDKEKRYKTIKDVLADLKAVKRNLQFQNNVEITAQPYADRNHPQTQSLHSATADEQNQTAEITAEREYVLPKSLIATGAIAVISIAIFAGWYFLAEKLFSEELPFARIKIEEITSAAEIQNPVISPDGKFIAYSKSALEGQFEKKSLIVRQTGSGSENVIYEAPGEEIEAQTFSPDGEFIYFLKRTSGDKKQLYKISALGGSPTIVLDRNVSAMAISPDGKKIAFTTRNEFDNHLVHRSINLADIDGSNSEELLNLKDVDALSIGLGNWHPDGTKLLFGIFKYNDSKGPQSFAATLDVSNKDLSRKDRVRIFYETESSSFRAGFWMPDGKGIIFSVLKDNEENKQLWYLSYPEAEIRQITDDYNDYEDLKLASDGKSIIGTIRTFPTSVWSVDPAKKSVREVIREHNNIGNASLSSATDGKIYYWKRVKHKSVIYSNSPEREDEKELFTVEGRTNQFTTDPNGTFVVAGLHYFGKPSISLFRYNFDGSQKIQLTDVENAIDTNPQITTQGYVLFNRSWFSAREPVAIMSVPLAGGITEKIELGPSDGDHSPRLSPDGKYLAYVRMTREKPSGESKMTIRVVEFENGKAGKLILEKTVLGVRRTRWTPESDALIYAKQNEDDNLFKLTLFGENETQISDFTQKADTGHFEWSPDGKKILVLRSTSVSNLVLIKDVTAIGN